MIKSQHHHTDSTSTIFFDLLIFTNPPIDVSSPPIKKVIVQGPVARPKLLFFQKQGVVQEGEGVKDIEPKLSRPTSANTDFLIGRTLSNLFSQNKGIMYQRIEADLKGILVWGFRKGSFRGVIEKVRGADGCPLSNH